MAPRGRKPKPNVVKGLFGNPGKRPIEDDGPEFETYERLPRPPSGLGYHGKIEWMRMGNELIKAGLLFRVCFRGLELYCKCYQIYKEAEKDINDTGLKVSSPNGYKIPNPSLSTLKSMEDKMRKWLSEFGLTPSSMSRVAVKPKEGGKNKAGSFFD